MPSDVNGDEFTEFELEEIALGRGAEARRRLATHRPDHPAWKRLADIRVEIDRYREVLESAADDEGVETPSEMTLSRYLDGSLEAQPREEAERALAGSRKTRKQLVSLFQEVRACEAGVPLTEALPSSTSVEAPTERTVVLDSGGPADAPFGAARSARMYGGLVSAVIFITIAYAGTAAWQIPAAVAAVVAAATTVVGVSVPRRLVGRGSAAVLVLISLGGLTLGVLDTEHVAAACAIVACGVILLYGQASLPSETRAILHKKKARSPNSEASSFPKSGAGQG